MRVRNVLATLDAFESSKKMFFPKKNITKHIFIPTDGQLFEIGKVIQKIVSTRRPSLINQIFKVTV